MLRNDFPTDYSIQHALINRSEEMNKNVVPEHYNSALCKIKHDG